MDIHKVNGVTGMIHNNELGLVLQWLEPLVQDMDEQQFWDYFMELYNEGLTEREEASIEARREMNKHLVPADFDILINMVFAQIIMDNLETLKRFGYEDIPVRYHIGGK